MSTEAPPAPPTNILPSAPPANTPPSSGISEPWAKEFIAPDFTLNHKALERLPDHLKPLRPTLEKYKSFEDVLVGFQNQQVLAGKKALSPLPPDAPATALTERKALIDQINGVPPTPKDYGITRPQDFPENLWDAKMADSYAAWAHKNSVSPAAAKELVALQIAATKESLASQQQYETQFWAEQQKSFESVLRQQNIPVDRAAALVEKGATALGLDLNNEATKTLLKGSEARLMALRHAIAIGEDNAVTEQGSGKEAGNPAELAADIRSNPANPLNGPFWNRDGKHSRAAQEAAVERVNELLKLAHAQQEKQRR